MDSRGISPVVGVLLITGITVILGAVVLSVFGSIETENVSPDVVWETQTGDFETGIIVEHIGGDKVSIDNIEVQGAVVVEKPTNDINAGSEIVYYPTNERVQITWGEEDTTAIIYEEQFDLESLYFSYTLDKETGDITEADGVEFDGAIRAETGGIDFSTDDGKEVFIGGSAVANEEVEFDNGGLLVGSVISESDDVTLNSIEVIRDVESGDTATIKDESLVQENVSADDTVVLTGDSTVRGEVDAGDDVQIKEGSTAEGSITANTVDLNNATVEAGIDTDGEIDIDSNSTVNGDITAGGDVDADNDSIISGDIIADGDVDADDDSIISGDIIADGDVDIEQGVVVKGDVIASGTVDVTGEVEGEICEGCEV